MSAFWSPWPRGVLGGGALLVLIRSVLDRVGPVGCRLSGVLRGCGGPGRIHLPQRQLKYYPWEEQPIRFLDI